MQLRGIDTNLIVPLRALLLHQNVTRAAKEVGLSQSSMSHALSRLRAHFDDPLLVTAGREMVLTERARTLLEPVSETYARLETLFARPEPFDPKTSRRTFRIAATDNLELYVLPHLAETLRREAPGVNVRVCALPEDWPRAIQRGDIDLKLGAKYAVPESLESQVVSREDFSCVVRKGHPLRKRLTPRQYAALDHLLIAPSTPVTAEPAGAVDAALGKLGLRRRVVMSVPHFLVAPFIVARSDLALTAPTRLLAPFVTQLRLRWVELPLKVPSYELSQVWATRARDDDAHRWLREAVARSFAP